MNNYTNKRYISMLLTLERQLELKRKKGTGYIRSGEDLGNLVLFFCYHQNPFGLCCLDQDESFHWSTSWTDLPPCSYYYPYYHGWIPRSPLHFLGTHESPQLDTCGTYATPQASPPQKHRGVSCRRQPTWPENKTHKFWAFLEPNSQTPFLSSFLYLFFLLHHRAVSFRFEQKST